MKIPTKALLSTKTGNVGLLGVGLYFLLINIVFTGAIDYPNAILGLTFIAVAVILAKPKPLVLSGLVVGFLGLTNLLTIANVFPIDTAWMLSAVFAIIVLVLELGNMKIGKAAKLAQSVVVIPLLSLFFMFILAFAGLNPALSVDFAIAPLKAFNYICLMLLTGVMAIDRLGWKLLKNNQGMWLTVFALAAIVTSFLGVAQGSLGWL